ncbi:MAG: hypothetical protein SVZ03_04600 [Spirochaetota bacterium]|nr:hypothetical protein [Spirochaetota bacterium]
MLGFYGRMPGYRSLAYGVPYNVYASSAYLYPFNGGYGIPYAPLYSNPFLYPRFGIGFAPRFGRGMGMGRGRGWRRW